MRMVSIISRVWSFLAHCIVRLLDQSRADRRDGRPSLQHCRGFVCEWVDRSHSEGRFLRMRECQPESPALSQSPSLLLCQFLVLHLACFLLQSMAFVRTCGSWRSRACLAGTSMQSVSQSSVFCSFASKPELSKGQQP